MTLIQYAMLYTCESKTNESKLGVKPKKKSKTDKLINQMKISIGKEIETMRGETSIHKKNKYPNTRKATKVVRTYKVPRGCIYSKYQRGTKAKNTGKKTRGKTI